MPGVKVFLFIPMISVQTQAQIQVFGGKSDEQNQSHSFVISKLFIGSILGGTTGMVLASRRASAMSLFVCRFFDKTGLKM
jgi:hypothetical protein